MKNENPEGLELSEQDLADLQQLHDEPEAEEKDERTLLKLWLTVLGDIEASAAEEIELGIAFKVVSSWPFLKFQETQRYHELYHDYLLDVRELLRATVNDHPGCEDHTSQDDMTENYEIYKTLVIGWNLLFDDLDGSWVATDKESHIKAAALVDARGMIFGGNGLAGHLDARGFTMDFAEIEHAIRANRGEL